MHWMTVENNYQPAEDKHFITIGNFQRDWMINNRVKPDSFPANEWLYVYYFIDAVEVTKVDNFDCTCDIGASGESLIKPAYYFKTEPRPKNLGDTSCCYNVYISHDNLPKICHIDKAVVYYMGEDSVEHISNVFTQNEENIMVWLTF